MNRIHWSAKSIDVLKDRVVDGSGKGMLKPRGLWYSFGNAWERWCRGENFHIEDLRYCYEIDVSEANFLVLNSEKEIKKFSDEYLVPFTNTLASYLDREGHHLRNWLEVPDWATVAKKYDGIEIPRYLNKCRFEYLWYSGWDVASGVVWNATKAKINLVKEILK